jgi:hypothetical protein
MSDNLSKPYRTRDEAAMGGFENLKKSNESLDTYEFAFYIVRLFKDRQITYKYTPPAKIGANGGETSWRLAPGQTVQAYCHTHPKRIQHDGFSPDDLAEYIEKAKIYSGMVWYLMTWNQQLRLAESKDEISKGGRPIQWLSWITP